MHFGANRLDGIPRRGVGAHNEQIALRRALRLEGLRVLGPESFLSL